MKLYLISTPGTTPWYTSIQTGTLKAYIDQRFKDLTTKAYAAHISILLDAFHRDYEEFYNKFESNHELLWYYLVLKNFYPKPAIKKLLINIKKHIKIKDLGRTLINMERAAKKFAEMELGKDLSSKELNLIGLSINSEQLYSSIFCTLYLKRRFPKHKMLFLFGGGQLAFPRVMNVLRNFNIDGLAVIGEGELKLEKIISVCLNNRHLSIEDLMELCDRSMPGIYRILSISDKEAFMIRASKESQLKSIEDLPAPNYDDYFEVLRRYSYDEKVYNALKERVLILFDGSRGCTHSKCDFCGLNISWCKYRSKTPKKIFNSISELAKKHGVNRVQFSDNICDHWIHDVLDIMLKNKSHFRSVFELRAIHKQTLFTKLYLSGSLDAQIGIEAVTDGLLLKMNKGTSTIDNIQTLKYMEELGFESHSNLITHHIKSDLNDIKETKKNLLLIKHFKKLNLSRFTLAESSPIYNQLSYDQIKRINIRKKIQIPKELKRYYTDRLELQTSKSTCDAWNKFIKWYETLYKKGTHKLQVLRLDKESSIIKKDFDGLIETKILTGQEDLVYRLCHTARSNDELLKICKIEEAELNRILNKFVLEELMIHASDKYLSLALRNKEELIQEYLTDRSS